VNQNPVVQERPWTEPSEQFAEFAGQPHCVWLDTVAGATGWSILATKPSKVLRSKGSRVDIISSGGTRRAEGNPFDFLEEHLALHHLAGVADFPIGAAIGYFGYDLKNFVEELPSAAIDDLGLPDCWFGFYDHLLVFDHAAHRVFEVGRAIPTRDRSRAKMNVRGAFPDRAAIRSNFTRDSYRAAVLRAKQYIAAGDVYQVNLAQRFECDVNASQTRLYLGLRQSNPAPYGAYLDIGEAQILSTSPECFLNVRDRRVVTRPIKGTRARGADVAEDARMRAELLASPKDNAELVMITDLERNDLGRVCEFGSVRVSELVRVETYPTVHHLVSTVEGLLRRDVSHIGCVRACFPGGSVTGAPKIRAMEIIDELEPHARGVYTGAIGFLGYNAVTRLNIAIRTVVNQNGRLTFHSGGGIVADSEPDAEYDETLAKARGIRNAVEQLCVR
jgi:para-aminobenzoate synthetase component I